MPREGSPQPAGATPIPVDVRRPGVDPQDYPVRFPVIALIASAGGIDAFLRVLGPLPAQLPAAFLVVLHQEPTRPSELVAILQRRTSLKVEVAANDAQMQPGRVLVVPPGRHLLVTSQARVGLIESGDPPPWRPSADLLLATLAVVCGTRALAVILTGLGHDAQAGVRAVAHCGGTVFAQDAVTAKFHAMAAAAIATTRVDQILALDDIPGAILRHVAERG